MRKKLSGLGKAERKYWFNQIGVTEGDDRFLIAQENGFGLRFNLFLTPGKVRH